MDQAIWDELSSEKGIVTEAGFGGLFDLPAVLKGYEAANQGRVDWQDAREYQRQWDSMQAGFEAYNLKQVFPDTRALMLATQHIEAVGTALQSEARRLSPDCAGMVNTLVGNAWEHFGALDIWREPKALLGALERVYAPLIMPLWPRRAATWAEEGLVVDVWAVNDSALTGAVVREWILEPVDNPNAGAPPRRAGVGSKAPAPAWPRGKEALILRAGIQSLPAIMVPPEICLRLPEGAWRLTAWLRDGDGHELTRNTHDLFMARRAGLKPVATAFAVTADDAYVRKLRGLGLTGAGAADASTASLIIMYDPEGCLGSQHNALLRRVAAGATAVFILGDSPRKEPEALVDMPDDSSAAAVFSLQTVSSEGNFIGWYHFLRPHPLFAGLPTGGLMGQIFRDLCPRESLRGDYEPGTEFPAGGFTTGWGRFDFDHAADLAIIPYGKGRLIVTTLPLGRLAGGTRWMDRILRNLVVWALIRSMKCDRPADQAGR